MLGDLKSSPIEQLRGRAASVEQGPVKLSVQTFGLLLTPTLAGLVPALSPALLHPSAHTCPDSTMMMYFWVSTAPLKCGYLLTPLRYAQSWRVERVWRMCQSVLQPLHYIQCEFERVCGAAPPTCMNRADGFSTLMCFIDVGLLQPEATEACHVCSAFKRNRMFGCDCYPRQYLHEFVNSPPLDCQTTQHAAETVSLRLRTTRGLSGTCCDFLACAVSNAFCVILLFSSPIYLSQAEFHKLNGIKRRMRIITDC